MFITKHDLPVYFGNILIHKSTTSDFELIDYQITIPAKCIFSVGMRCSYNNSKVYCSCISTSGINKYSLLAYDENASGCSYTGYVEDETTLKFYGKWETGGDNFVEIGGFYKSTG